MSRIGDVRIRPRNQTLRINQCVTETFGHARPRLETIEPRTPVFTRNSFKYVAPPCALIFGRYFLNRVYPNAWNIVSPGGLKIGKAPSGNPEDDTVRN